MVAALLAQENGVTSNWLKKLPPFSNQHQCLGMSNQSEYKPFRLLTLVLTIPLADLGPGPLLILRLN